MKLQVKLKYKKNGRIYISTKWQTMMMEVLFNKKCPEFNCIMGVVPIRLAQPRTTSCGWVVGITWSGRAETGTPPSVPAGGRGGPNWQPACYEATAAALLGRRASCTSLSVQEAGSSRGANARGSRH